MANPELERTEEIRLEQLISIFYLLKVSFNLFHQGPVPEPVPPATEESILDPWRPQHSKRRVVHPRELEDFVPSAGRGFQLSQFTQEPSPQPEAPNDPPADLREPSPTPPPAVPNYITEPNEFSLYRIYQQRPSSIPDVFLDPEDVADAPAFRMKQDMTPAAPKGLGESFGKDLNPISAFAPFKNEFDFHMAHWHLSNHEKSHADTDRLVHDIMHADFFNKKDIPPTWSCKSVCETLDKPKSTTPLPFSLDNGWTEHSVTLPLPCSKFRNVSEADAPTITINGVWLRDPIELLKSAVKDMSFLSTHLKGFRQMWKPSEDRPAIRVHSEAYSSDLYWDLEAELIAQAAKGPDQTPIETVILPIKGFSDSTMLTNFGSASLWPIYWSLGCLSKYYTAKRDSFAFHHLAYTPSVSDLIISRF